MVKPTDDAQAASALRRQGRARVRRRSAGGRHKAGEQPCQLLREIQRWHAAASPDTRPRPAGHPGRDPQGSGRCVSQAKLGKGVAGEAWQAHKSRRWVSVCRSTSRGARVTNASCAAIAWPRSHAYLEKSWQPRHSAPIDNITPAGWSGSGARRSLPGRGLCRPTARMPRLAAYVLGAIDRDHLMGANPTADIKPLKQGNVSAF
jgi:hypothetical protein